VRLEVVRNLFRGRLTCFTPFLFDDFEFEIECDGGLRCVKECKYRIYPSIIDRRA
jgi:hypothetical protein